jgi:diguanylate cyclase (GGDEF)-like protein
LEFLPDTKKGYVKMMSKEDLLKRVSIFSGLTEEELRIISRYCRYYRYAHDKVIFDERNLGEELFIIKSGEVRITKHRGDDDMDIARFISGESFGELELLDKTPRSAVATAVGDTNLLHFPGRGFKFRDILERHADIFAPVLQRLLAMIAERIRSTNRLISENSPWIQDLRRQLYTDKLTGLFNRTFLEEDFAELLPKYGEGTALIMVKPDRFKHINDSFGHEAGDRVLKEVAKTLRSVIGDERFAARYRGDEYAAIIPSIGVQEARRIAGDIKRAVGSIDLEPLVGGTTDAISVSIGIALFPRDGSDNMELIQCAFELMFMARGAGGDLIFCAGDKVEVR